MPNSVTTVTEATEIAEVVGGEQFRPSGRRFDRGQSRSGSAVYWI